MRRVCVGEKSAGWSGRGGGQRPVVLPTDRAGEHFVVSSLTPSLTPSLTNPLTGSLTAPDWDSWLELFPGVLSAGGRSGQAVVGQLQVLPGLGVLVELEQAGDEVAPGGPRLWMVHPAGLDDAPQPPGTVLRPAHPVAVLYELQQSLQAGNVPVGSLAPGHNLPQQDPVGPDIGLNSQ